MKISSAEVEKVSLLARLLLEENELSRMTGQMGDILAYMDLLSEVDTDRVEPMAHAMDVSDVFRDDIVRPSLDRDRALRSAPHRDAECYLVPAVLGEA
jgi:aspartyl-tRNA(Asn)/glutamyl-tRNA(Gln) amidotransferase subunit C